MKTTIILLLAFLPIAVLAQSRYCEIVLPTSSLSSVIHPKADFGTINPSDTISKYIPPIEQESFATRADLINYMSRYHWELVSGFTSGSGAGLKYHYLMRLDMVGKAFK